MPSFQPIRAMPAVVLAALLLAACGKDKPPTTAPAPVPKAVPAVASTVKPTPAPPAPAVASTAFRVSAVTLGHSVDEAHKVTAPGTRFAPDEKTIYASVASTGSAREVALGARWNYLEGAGQLITSVTQRLATDGPATTTFTLQNPDLWPEGKYNVEISVDGKLAVTEPFEIAKPVK
ncbi:MAG: hypothetical protein ABI300_07760 [Rhodanobacter sp.]